MAAGFTILITDRNRHVRNFLRRELSAEGYQVEVAADGRDLLRKINAADAPDLLILDLEIPYAGGAAILKRLRRVNSRLPVIVHGFATEDATHASVQQTVAFIEKMGNTDRLKSAVFEVLREYYPNRFATNQREGGGVR
ncbi:MAG: response regulator [Syntrophobacterales bacterium]